MYGPKSMQQKNTITNISTNSVRLEPLDLTSIHLMKSLSRINSAPASLSNDIESLESIGNSTTTMILIILNINK